MKIGNLKKFIILLICVIALTSCTITPPSLNLGGNNDNNSNENDSNLTVGEKIKAEHDALVNKKTDKHTSWRFSGTVVDMTETNFNTTDGGYDVRLILTVDGILMAVYDGLVNGIKPKTITGLEVGTVITVTGKIDENETFNSGSYSTDIQFTSPKITWSYSVDSDDNGDDSGNNDNNGDNSGNTGDNTGNTGDNSGNTGDNTGNNGSDSGNTDTNYNPIGDVTDKTIVGNVYFSILNDTHGAFTDSNDGYSMARVDTLFDGLEGKNGDYIKIATGDMLQGSYTSSKTYGLTIIETLNEMDFDAFVIGNHEFDWGLDKIAKYKDGDLSNGEADFPFLGANIYKKGTTIRPDWIEPYTVINYGELKVGIIGILGGDQESDISAQYIKDYEFVDNPANIIKQCANELRMNKECDVVVLATHDHDTSDFEGKNYISSLLTYTGTARIDAIFAGHSHWKVNESYTRKDGVIIPVVQNKTKNQTAQEVILNYNASNTVISGTSNCYYPSNYAESSDLDYIYEKYATLINESNQVFGTTSYQLSKATIGEYIVEAMAKYDYNNASYDNIACAIINTSGVRTVIDSGDITAADVYNALPFENEIILVKIDGRYLNSISSTYYYTYKTTSTFATGVTYQVSIIDFVYYGGYLSNIINNKKEEYHSGIVMRDPFIEYIKTNF